MNFILNFSDSIIISDFPTENASEELQLNMWLSSFQCVYLSMWAKAVKLG
jgi:hypothetical protein